MQKDKKEDMIEREDCVERETREKTKRKTLKEHRKHKND